MYKYVVSAYNRGFITTLHCNEQSAMKAVSAICGTLTPYSKEKASKFLESGLGKSAKPVEFTPASGGWGISIYPVDGQE